MTSSARTRSARAARSTSAAAATLITPSPRPAAKLGNVDKLPFSMKVLLENPAAFQGRGHRHRRGTIQALVDWQATRSSTREIW
jgi:aconitate hydratase